MKLYVTIPELYPFVLILICCRAVLDAMFVKGRGSVDRSNVPVTYITIAATLNTSICH